MIWITCHGDTKSLGIKAIKKRFPEFLPGIKGKSLPNQTNYYLFTQKENPPVGHSITPHFSRMDFVSETSYAL